MKKLVMGDFNVPKRGDKLFEALTSHGLQVPDALLNLKAGDQVIGGSTLDKDARYDQILHLPTLKKRFSNVGGTRDFFGSDAGIKERFPDKDYTRQQFSFPTTFQSGYRSRPILTVRDSIRWFRIARRYRQQSSQTYFGEKQLVGNWNSSGGITTTSFNNSIPNISRVPVNCREIGNCQTA